MTETEQVENSNTDPIIETGNETGTELTENDQNSQATGGGLIEPTATATFETYSESNKTAEELAAEIQSALWARDMTTLEALMANPFVVGYWQSEGRSVTPTEITAELSASRLPANSANLTFTTDRSQFPDLGEIPVDAIFGPNNNTALIIFSEGWGFDGQGEAFLYLLYDHDGQVHFTSILFAGQSFDGPDPVPGPSPEALAAQIQAAFWARDMTTLETLMANPFVIGYWQSEGRSDTPAGIVAELSAHHLPANTSNLTFITDRSQFPDLAGMPVEGIFGPNNIALIIFSQGWGMDGIGEALLYLVYDATGQAQFSYILVAGQSFDGPDPVPGPSPEALAAQIQAALWARDMATLETLMANPFVIGYWQSEGRSDTPAGIVAELSTYHLPANTANLTFTTDRSQFPDLGMIDFDRIFGPNDIAMIIYSEGWGAGGQGAAFLYLVYDAAGQARFSYILYDGESFD